MEKEYNYEYGRNVRSQEGNDVTKMKREWFTKIESIEINIENLRNIMCEYYRITLYFEWGSITKEFQEFHEPKTRSKSLNFRIYLQLPS